VMLKLVDGTLGLMTALRHNEAGYDIHVEIHAAKDTLAIGIDPRTPWRSVEADAPKLAGPAYPSFFVRFDSPVLTPDSAYFAAAPTAAPPMTGSRHGTLRLSVCPPGEKICRLVEMAVAW